MVDAEKVIRDFLLLNAALVALVDDRIYAGVDLPPGYKPGDGPAVLFAVRGGADSYHSGTFWPSCQYSCYAATEREAREVYRALYDALNDQAGVNINQSRLETPGQILRDQDTDWPFVLTAFRHWIRNE